MSAENGESASIDAPEPVGATSTAPDRTPLLLWAVVSVISVLVRSISNPGGWALDRWDTLAQWDSNVHLAVADHGQRSAGEYVLPGYGLLVRSTTWVTGNRITTAVLVAYAASAAASWLLWEWLRGRDVDRVVRIWSVLALLVFPYSFVLYGVVGADALCLALVLGSFVLIERDHPVAAGLLGALAITIQVTAVALIPALIVLGRTARPSAEEDGSDRPGKGASLAAALTLLGPIAVTAYSWWAADDALRPWRGDGAFGGLSTGVLRPVTWVRLAWIVDDGPASWMLHRGAQAVLLIVVAIAAFWVRRRFGTAMGVFVLAVPILTVVGFADTASSGRRLTLAFPVAALAGAGLARLPRAVAAGIVTLSAAGLFACYSFFIHSSGFPFW